MWSMCDKKLLAVILTNTCSSQHDESVALKVEDADDALTFSHKLGTPKKRHRGFYNLDGKEITNPANLYWGSHLACAFCNVLPRLQSFSQTQNTSSARPDPFFQFSSRPDCVFTPALCEPRKRADAGASFGASDGPAACSTFKVRRRRLLQVLKLAS